DSGNRVIWCTNWNLATVSVISDATNTVVATVNVGLGPEGLAYDNNKGEVFVANDGQSNTSTDTVTVISDTGYIVVATITVGGFPCGVAYDSATHEAFVTDRGQRFRHTVSVTPAF